MMKKESKQTKEVLGYWKERALLEAITGEPGMGLEGISDKEADVWDRVTDVVLEILSKERKKTTEKTEKSLIKLRESVHKELADKFDPEVRHKNIDDALVEYIDDEEITELYEKLDGWGWYA